MKKLYLIICFLVFSSIAKADDSEWIYGLWVTVGVSQEVADKHYQETNTPVEKHIIYFDENGTMLRYSKSVGFKKLLIEFKVEGDVVMMKPKTEIKFFPLSRRRSDGKLEIYYPPKGGFLYEKTDKNIFDINLEGTPEITEIE